MKLAAPLFALTVLAALTVPAAASAQSCSSAENCFCAPSSAADGIYWGVIEGGDATGSQIRVTQIVESNSTGSDPNVTVEPDILESAGTELLFSSTGYLVVNADGTVSCPNGTFGDGLRLTQNEVQTLMVSASCFTALDSVNFSGTYPPCDDAGLGTGGTLACAASNGGGATGFALALAGLALVRRRRR